MAGKFAGKNVCSGVNGLRSKLIDHIRKKLKSKVIFANDFLKSIIFLT